MVEIVITIWTGRGIFVINLFLLRQRYHALLNSQFLANGLLFSMSAKPVTPPSDPWRTSLGLG